ncbi:MULTISPECIES: MFS transporter [Gordonibacter]|uniref:MFS transporter n=1 Tax=Gordonibacter faecis TaxID=3047475 RepID=A0ABT7DM54_9ACTN|nr:MULTISPECIES: MFS transporter [unclassified Gordonibacter]MDJ1650614.1 MFS transporter [Gordonibacter sp. KGMB12511]HIW75782.1 MFS transporter [Candidatus Gordonibacter avicola]
MPAPKTRFHYAWLILIGCCFMQAGGLGAVLDAAGVFFVPVCEDLGFLRSELSLYLTFYFIATVFAMPIVGKWITKFDLNRVLSVSFALVVAAVAAMGFYTEPWQWWISGVVFGLAGSFIFVVPAPILIGNWFHTHRGLALGVAMSFSGIGGAALGPVFTLLIQTVGWREAYFIAAGIMALLVLPWTLVVFKLRPEDMGLKPYGWTEADEQTERVREERHEGLPGVPLSKALKTVPFVCMFLFSGLIAYFAGFNSHLPGYAQSIGFSAMVGSSLLTAVMVGNVVEKLLIGWLNDKVGVQFTVNIQLAMVALGFMGFILAGDNLVLLYVSAFLFGAQNSLVSVSTPLLIRQLFGERDFPAIFTYARIGTGVIGCLGPVTVAAVFDATGSFVPAFMLGIGITVLGFVTVRLAYAFRGRLHWIERDQDEAKSEDTRIKAIS